MIFWRNVPTEEKVSIFNETETEKKNLSILFVVPSFPFFRPSLSLVCKGCFPRTFAMPSLASKPYCERIKKKEKRKNFVHLFRTHNYCTRKLNFFLSYWKDFSREQKVHLILWWSRSMFSFEESYGNLSKHTQEAALFANTYYMLYTYYYLLDYYYKLIWKRNIGSKYFLTSTDAVILVPSCYTLLFEYLQGY